MNSNGKSRIKVSGGLVAERPFNIRLSNFQKPIRMRLLPLSVAFICALVVGCQSSATKHASAASAITGVGNATIENFAGGANIGIGEVARSFHVYEIDGDFVAKGRVNGVFTLTPGHHTLAILVQFTHITGVLATRSIDAAKVDIPIEAQAAQRYSIAGREFERDSAEIWITNVSSGAEVGEHKAFAVNTTVQSQNVPILIPIPIR